MLKRARIAQASFVVVIVFMIAVAVVVVNIEYFRCLCLISFRIVDIYWLEFNGTFGTIRLYRAFRSYSLVYVLETGSTLWALYISCSVVDDQRHK